MAWQRKAVEERGILLACDDKQEWLLPWWWSNYTQENNLPVTIIDLGMSAKGRNWCAGKCERIPFAFDSDFIKEKAELDPDVRKKWKLYGKHFWQARQGWFKKPLCMLQSRFKYTLWLDLDCEILGSLAPIFDSISSKDTLAIAREPQIYQGNCDNLGEVLYNSGVILYRHGSQPIRHWAKESITQNAHFWSDQHLLSRLIFTQKISIRELPENFNAQLSAGIPINPLIIHWVGSWGKAYIKTHGGLRKDLEKLLSREEK